MTLSRTDSTASSERSDAPIGVDRRWDLEAWLTVACTLVLLISAWIPPKPIFGEASTVYHRALLVPFVGFAYLVALKLREWRLFAPAAAVIVAIPLTMAVTAAAGIDHRFSIVSVGFLLMYWAPVPPIRQTVNRHRILWITAILPVPLIVSTQLMGWADPIWTVFEGNRLASSQFPNELAWTLLLGIVASHALWRETARPLPRWLMIVYLALLGLTGARLAALVIAGLGAFIAVDRLRHGHRLGAIARELWPWILMVGTILWMALPRTLSGPSDDAVLGVATSYRTYIWDEYLSHPMTNLLTGGGWGHWHDIASTSERFPGWPPHNEYLMLLLDVGVVGMILVVAALVIAWLRRIEWLDGQHRSYVVLPILFALAALIDNIWTGMPLTLPFAVLWAALGGGGSQEAARSAGSSDPPDE